MPIYLTYYINIDLFSFIRGARNTSAGGARPAKIIKLIKLGLYND